MNNAALLNTVELSVELSENQLDDINGGALTSKDISDVFTIPKGVIPAGGSSGGTYSGSTACSVSGGVKTCTTNVNGQISTTVTLVK
jgi:hypothetical protein